MVARGNQHVEGVGSPDELGHDRWVSRASGTFSVTGTDGAGTPFKQKATLTIH
jgi:hypothetical protein